MATNYGSLPVVTNGLVLYVDAANNVKSFTPGTATWSDMSGFGNDMTLLNGPASSSNPASINTIQSSFSVMSFDQNAAADNASTAQVGYGNFTGYKTDNYTFDLWINTTDNSTAVWGKGIIGCISGDIWSQLVLKDNKFAFLYYTNQWLTLSSTTSINDGNWHHCVFVNHSNSTGDIYIDGVIEQDGGSTNYNTTGRYTKLSTLGRGYGTGQTGTLDNTKFAQVKVYDRALTAAEVLKNYNSAKGRFE